MALLCWFICMHQQYVSTRFEAVPGAKITSYAFDF